MRIDPMVQCKMAAQRTLDAEAGPDLASYVANVSRRVSAMQSRYGLRLRYAQVAGKPLTYPCQSGAATAVVAEAPGHYDADVTAPATLFPAVRP